MNKRHFLISGIVALSLAATFGLISPVGGPAQVLAASPTMTIVHGCGGHVSFTNVPATWSVTFQPGGIVFAPGADFTDIELDPNLYSYVWTDDSGTVMSSATGLDIHVCPGSSPPRPTVACATHLVSFVNAPDGWWLVTAPNNNPNPEFWDSGFGALGPFSPGTYNYQWYNGVIGSPTGDAYLMTDTHSHDSFIVPTHCPTPVPTHTPTPTPSPSATPTATPTATASPTATPTATASPSPMVAPSAISTPTASPTPVPLPIGGSSSEPDPLYLILGLLLGAALVLGGGAGFLFWRSQVNPNQNQPPPAGMSGSRSHEVTTDVTTDVMPDGLNPPNEPLGPSV